MRFTVIFVSALAAGLAAAAPQPATQQADTLESVLARAGEYVAGFERQLAGIVAEEHYAQEAQVSSVTSGGIGGGMDTLGARRSTRAEQRRYLKADVLLVRPEGANEWVQYRDAFEVDGQPVHGRDDRLAKLFLQPSESSARQAEQIDAATTGYNIGGIAHSMSVPVRALVVLDPAIQPRFKFKRRSGLTEGLPPSTKLFEVPKATWVIQYDEAKKPTLVRLAGDRDLPIHGRLWIEPSSGRVLISELVAEDRKTRATVLVSYQSPPLLGLLVPAEMRDQYEGDANSPTLVGTATYTNVRQFPLKPIGAR